jgi:putative nucleotidyltransferase with HDIG domain
MATSTKPGKLLNQPQRRWFVNLLENLSSKLTLTDVCVGLCATVLISFILTGFRYPAIPAYGIGQIAERDVRAAQDVTYEDAAATIIRREEAEAAIPALYQIDSDLISERERNIAKAFSRARDVLSRYAGAPAAQKALKEIEAQVAGILPAEALPVLLRHSFSPVLENRIVKILDMVLRDGIIADREQFLKDQRAGIVTRSSAHATERPLAAGYLARDIPSAKEYVRQSGPNFSALSSRDQAAIGRFLESSLFPTLLYNREETELRRAAAASQVSPIRLQIKQGQVILRSGEQVTSAVMFQLDALRSLRRPRSLLGQFGGYCLISAILIYSIWRYLVFYQARHRKLRSNMTLMLVLIACGLLAIRLATVLADILGERFQRFHDPAVLYYGIPFAFCALLTTLLVDVHLGIVSSLILAVLTGLFYGDIDIAAYIIAGCLGAIYSVRQYKDRAAILKAGFTIGFVNTLALAALGILRQAPLNISDVTDLVILAFLSGVLSSALASMLLPGLESIFKIVTDVRLLELSNLNAPLLRRLSIEAPGTYHHSLMVAALAEGAAEAIGANPLLARVASYYHDVGKVIKPEFFVENQSGDHNKHEELPPDLSSRILAGHVGEGLQLAKESGLPQLISDMIPQHHGTRVMTYFYQKAKDSATDKDGEPAEADFRYPGPTPQSREAAIIMMADTVEAASRTLSEPTKPQIQRMIERLVDSILFDGQLVECEITLKDVQRVKESFFKILTGTFHHRIDYPGYDFKEKGDDSKRVLLENPGSE